MKRLALVLCAFLVFSLCGCGEQESQSLTSGTPSVPSVVLSDTDQMDLTIEELPQSTPSSTTTVDLTTSTVSQVENPSSSEGSSAPSTPSSPQGTTSSAPNTVVTTPQSLTITDGGDYLFTGEKTNATLTVNAPGKEVTITLSGVTVNNANGPALYVKAAKKVTLILAEGTTNTLTDGTAYSLTDGDTVVDASLFSRADLTLGGKGTLVVNGNYKHGIVCKDDLVFTSGTYQITAKNVAIDGKDCVKASGGSFTVNALTDGIRASNIEDPNKGFIYLSGGTFQIASGNDSVQAATLLKIENATITATARGGHQNAETLEGSFKGLKAGADIQIFGGTFTLDTKDDAIHSDGTIMIGNGTFTIASGNDALQATTDLAVKNGTLTVSTCNDGLQATNVVITGGTSTLTVSQSGIQTTGNYYQSAGTLILYGSHGNGKAILNYAGTATMEGGTLLAFGDSSKSRHLTAMKNQAALLLPVSAQGAGTPFTLVKDGKTIATVTPAKGYSLVLVSTPDCALGSYSLQVGNKTATLSVETALFTLK